MVRVLGTIVLACLGTAIAAEGAPGADFGGGPGGLDSEIAILRTVGQPALDELLEQFEHADDPKLREQLGKKVDAVAGQRGATVSRLFWHTDFVRAQMAAAETGKPILSLRLLGKLTDEQSCANSRYFRTALYANKEISDYLREHYVLHWRSVRPVPRVRIDFGDGRVLERTITGNSAHYVLDASGRPLDVLPGLYGPRTFLDWLQNSNRLAREYRETAAESRDEVLAQYHGYALAALQQRLNDDLAAVSAERPNIPDRKIPSQGATAPPDALAAGLVAEGKTAAEAPIVRQILPGADRLTNQNEETWEKIAARYGDAARLDESSVAVIRAENPNATEAGALATAKRRVEDPVLRIVRNFESAIALDTVKNEYMLHWKIHEWFIEGQAPDNPEALNERVYSELFLTPSSDPWLGLAPAGVYTALQNGGVVVGP